MRHSRREIEHISGFQYPVLIRFKIRKDGDVYPLYQNLFLNRNRVDLPTPLPQALEQKNINGP